MVNTFPGFAQNSFKGASAQLNDKYLAHVQYNYHVHNSVLYGAVPNFRSSKFKAGGAFDAHHNYLKGLSNEI
jgi:hypothetical protein